MHRKLNDFEITQPRPENSGDGNPEGSRPQSNSDSAQQKALKCAGCGQPFLPTNPKLIPFCSLRCQQIDLAGWLDEENGLPWENDKFDQNVESESPPGEI